ncbi:hypothetical protein H4Q26_004588 [Puccinia striiformis f. sp. tritici PST-130]|nr:hypothetical protein H4Q26_004588 [Puccinia striiformis f. sp. tritici PST-130]
MNQQWSRRPFHQTKSSYETRIQYLEDVVHLLISRTNSPMPPLIFLASRLASFRYSKDGGLIPLLSEATAKSLAVARSEQHVPSHLARASTSSATRCQPPSNSVFSSATSLKRNDSLVTRPQLFHLQNLANSKARQLPPTVVQPPTQT